MSEVLASLKKIGGNGEQYTETVLWTNPSPTADFAAQTITLSDSISKYKYIGIKYCFNKTNTSIIDTAIYKTEELRASVTDSGTDHNAIMLGLQTSNNYSFSRVVGYVSDTSIKFTTGYRLNAASSSANACIPLEILGINELAHGEGVLATPFQLELKSTIANGRSVIAFDKSTFPYTKFRVISKVNNLRYIGNGSWVTLAVGDIVDFSALPDTNLTIDVSGSNTSTASTIEFYN